MFDNLGKEQQFLILGLIMAILVGCAVIVIKNYFPGSQSSAVQIVNPDQNEEKPIVPKIIVHISGAVKVSGVYSLKPGQRVMDAISAAGGYRVNADLDKINLAQAISDGQKIVIPFKSLGKNFEGEVESEKTVNINTAGLEELTKISGIGPATAKKIINYREKNGGFRSLDELKEVGGIGPKKLEKMKPYLKLY